MMQALEIVAGSWPIAIMVVGATGGFVVWSLLRRVIKGEERKQELRAMGTDAVLVQGRARRDGSDY